MIRALTLILFVLSFATGCASETVIHGVDEREANQIIELLARHSIDTTKVRTPGSREVVFDLSVNAGQRVDAIRLLNQNELPRRKDRGYSDVFAQSGLIPTSTEEKAKQLSALEGEIEKQLKLIEGILEAQVQIVIPTESPLRTVDAQRPAATASVTIKYLPGAGDTKPISEAQVKALVSAGVENLAPDKVYPLMTPVITTVEPVALGTTGSRSYLGRLTKTQANGLSIVVVVLICGLGGLFLVWHLRLRKIQERYERLQAEIQKARMRQSGGELPPSA
jgi:type III secretion protein J